MLPDTIGGPTGTAITDDPIGGIGTGDITAGIGIRKSSREKLSSVPPANYFELLPPEFPFKY